MAIPSDNPVGESAVVVSVYADANVGSGPEGPGNSAVDPSASVATKS